MPVRDKSKNTRSTSIEGLWVIEGPTFEDGRGFFREVLRLDELVRDAGVEFGVKQWNHSLSHPGVIRGLHAENWNKVVYPITGKVFLAIVDLRPDSPTFAKVETFEFNAREKHQAIFVPRGLANSICAIGPEDVHYLYLVDAYYDGKDTRAVAWDDPDLNIPWPVKNPVISERDRSNPRLRDLYPEKFR